ncbi:MAG TPA: transcription antitermination factor NusB [Rhizomicrobium sp.]|nr:transcription antitermination factor NusB [Rhizomicrobium sp.]
MSASRRAALAILSDVLRKRRPLDAALSHTDGLEARDAGFARAIAAETLRRFGQLDALIRTFVAKPPPPHKAGPTPEILLMGACELLFLGVAPHAAVDGANRLAQADNKAVHFKPLINAVLRRVAREGKEVLAKQDAARLNTPDWLWSRWTATYGEDTARAIAAAHLVQAPLTLVDKTAPRFDAVRRVDALPDFSSGEFWAQDAAATLPAHLLGDVRGRRVIDLCAAPGGKTAQLAAMGAQVIAVEREASRLERLKENMARLKLDATLIDDDVRDVRIEPAPLVLLDAPCTATGTIRRHPELPWIKSASDVTLVAGASAELLDCAALMTAPGGLLVFAVCSLEPEEGPEQIAAFLAARPDFTRLPLAAADVFGHAEFIDADGDLRTLPCHMRDEGGMDGFYAARLRRSS